MRREPLDWTLLAVLPAFLVLAFTLGGLHHYPAYDFRAIWQAGHDVAHGHNPYPAVPSIPTSPAAQHDYFIYPGVVAVAMVPFGLMPFGVAAGIFTAILVASVAAALRILGVRDWRCYGAAFLSIPVLESFRLGALSPLLALGLAGVWVMRDRRWALPVVVAAVVLPKLFLWPLFIWLLATRRWGAAARSALLTAVVGLIGWAVVGLDTIAPYPALLHKMTDVQFRNTVGVEGLLGSLGAGAATAHFGVVLVAVLGSAAIIVAARNGAATELTFGVGVEVEAEAFAGVAVAGAAQLDGEFEGFHEGGGADHVVVVEGAPAGVGVLVAQQPFGGEQGGVFGEVFAVHDQVLPVHVDLDVVEALAAEGVDDVQGHADVAHEDLHRRLRVLVLQEHGHALVLGVLGGLADAVDEPRPRLRVRGLERVVVPLDPRPDDHARPHLAGEVDSLPRQPERLPPHRVIRRAEAAPAEARVQMQTGGDAVDPVPRQRLLHLGQIVLPQLLRIVELVIVDQVSETRDRRPHPRRRRCPHQLRLIPTRIEPRRHPTKRPNAERSLHRCVRPQWLIGSSRVACSTCSARPVSRSKK